MRALTAPASGPSMFRALFSQLRAPRPAVARATHTELLTQDQIDANRAWWAAAVRAGGAVVPE